MGRHHLVLAALGAALGSALSVPACSGDASGPGTSSTGTAGATGSGGFGGGQGGDFPFGGFGGGGSDGGSPLGQFCNDQLLCPTGYVCEEGTCAVDCGAHARCDNTCCAEGDVCYLDACTTPGAACGDSGQTGCVAPPCPQGQQCDPTIHACMPVPLAASCTYVPQASFAPTLLWAWTGSQAHPAYAHVISTPAVADLDGDGASDIVVPVYDYVPGSPGPGGILCALSGAGDCAGGPRELWCTTPGSPLVNVVASAAIGDLTGSGDLTIIAGAARPGPSGWNTYGILGFDAKGNLLPEFGTDQNGQPVDMLVGVGAPAIADLDGDGAAEVFVGFTVFDHHGKLLWQGSGAAGNGNHGPLTIAADLDDDGMLELIGGNLAYRHDGTPLWSPAPPMTTFADGWPAVADFDGDGVPEIVVVSYANGASAIRVFDRDGQLYSAAAATVPGAGGPPTIADVDGDGVPDIAVAGQDSLTVFRVDPAPGHALTAMWQAASRDYSSNFTGSSVFDFEGDGHVEVLYGDECFARVYDDKGAVRFEVPNTSCTGTEYPLVADVNGDGKAEFVVVANNMLNTPSGCAPYVQACINSFPGYVPTNGVRVYRDANDNWVSTRSVWNQHSYHVTNVCDGRDEVCPAASNAQGRIPAAEPQSWAFPAGNPLNRYRANARLTDVFSAPDLVPLNARADLSSCPSAMTLRASVANVGAVGVPAGVKAAFYRLADASTRELVGVATTTKVLLPGASEAVSVVWPEAKVGQNVDFEVTVDDDGTGAGVVNECREDNNTAPFSGKCSSGPR